MAASRNRRFRSFFTSQLQSGFQQRGGLREFGQSRRCLLERRVMGNLLKSDHALQIWSVVQQRRDLPVVATLMFLQREDGEDLMLRERLGAAGMGIGGQCILGNKMT